ncbi:glycolate oxidase subunit GlcF [Betaproteobacteria bacterium SCN2]|jgi:glycolate oxidase iron-sulfur subunit|nr:glycolate oxidase subunit GlcF [Betaproteobacteria bacterium SCN2]
MQTQLADFIRDTADGQEADRILRACVHCGFCLATCPTYQILGDELDSPRGRIYLMKQMLEGATVTRKTLTHLDRCLTCRNCETTCPSGVQYGKLIDIGRRVAEQKVTRPPAQALRRRALAKFLPQQQLFGGALKLGRMARPFLPDALAGKIPPAPALRQPLPAARHARTMLALAGCVQPALAPQINAAAIKVLDAIGISLFEAARAGCCGAVSFHLNFQEEGLAAMRRNIDAWWPHVESGAEAIVMTASGCGVTVKEYGHYLRHDPAYAEKAARVSALTKDLSEVLLAEETALRAWLERRGPAQGKRVSFHAPCTLQHGQKITGVVEALLTVAGHTVLPVAESHLCCGSAGTYSLLEPEISMQLRDRKLGHLASPRPEVIASANIGCLTQLQSGTATPVRHWVELLLP